KLHSIRGSTRCPIPCSPLNTVHRFHVPICHRRSAELDRALRHPLNDPMFTLPSLSKLLVLGAILLAVWFGFRLLGQLDRMRKEEARLSRGEGGRSRARTGRARSAEIQDM